jgi:hypothetical protein
VDKAGLSGPNGQLGPVDNTKVSCGPVERIENTQPGGEGPTSTCLCRPNGSTSDPWSLTRVYARSRRRSRRIDQVAGKADDAREHSRPHGR